MLYLANWGTPCAKLLVLSALAALAAIPASAGEVGVLVDKQVGKAQVASFGTGQKYDAVSPTGFAIRAGFDVVTSRWPPCS